LVINMTRFFQDAEAFDVLAKQVFPELVQAHPADRPVRIWVVGCNTGEEAYSIAMLLQEEIAAIRRNLKLQMFATDIDGEAVALARDGLYPASIEADVPPARLARFFAKEGQAYRVSRGLRAAIVFSIHNATTDAPFSRLDLISCRDLLIHLRPEAQRKVLSLFNFALRADGVLVLGPSETIGDVSAYFHLVSQDQQVYRHISHGGSGKVEIPLGRGQAVRAPWLRSTRSPRTRAGVSDVATRWLLNAYVPASVLVNRNRQGLYYFGPTDLYLKMPTDAPSLDLLAAAREGLRPTIRAAFDRMQEELSEEPVLVAGHVMRDGRSVAVIVSAQTVRDGDEELIMLGFHDNPTDERRSDVTVEMATDGSRLPGTGQELNATHGELEVAIRDRESAEEEIRAVNEAAMSMSEELQIMDEELTTSRKQLQSLNDELTTLNNRLHETLSRHDAVANDLENILNSAKVAAVLLDDHLRVRSFTPKARELFSLIASDIGRPLTDLARHCAGDLLADARDVLVTLVPVARETKAQSGAWYDCRVVPYRTKDGRIDGVVITFVDVSTRKQTENELNAARMAAESANLGKSRFLAAASHDLRQPLQTINLLQSLLARRLRDTDELEFVTRSEDALSAMSGMLNTLLDINQLEAGIIRPSFFDFPINDILDRLKNEFGYHTAVQGLDLRVLPSRWAVHSDPRLLEQMIRNLLSNAVKYTRKGGILLGCRRRGSKIRIETWDTGLGIPETRLNSIFKEYHQIGNPGLERNQGLGLGLAIVKRLGELLGYSVEVRSRHGIGSVFSIEVPLAQEGRPLAQNDLQSERRNTTIRRGGSVLIVEDDPATRESLEILMREDGYATASASDGDEAIRILADRGIRPDIVIIDNNLPRGQTGLQVMALLRDLIGLELPALVLTGDISTATLVDIAHQGYAYRSKPIKGEDLSSLVRMVLDRKHKPASPAATPRPTIFVVDDNVADRDGLRQLLEGEGRAVAFFASAAAFLDAWSPDQVGCLIVDCKMPEMDGVELLERLKSQGHLLPAIMITGYSDVELAIRAMKAGAQYFIQKPLRGDELFAAIDQALATVGGSQGDTDLSDETMALIASLTSRERQVMTMVTQGMMNKQIAHALGVSRRTIENHRAAVMKKLGVTSLSQLIRLAMETIPARALGVGPGRL
jgi:two-component system, chemotaxis family, CheB/CheR fusion protein